MVATVAVVATDGAMVGMVSDAGFIFNSGSSILILTLAFFIFFFFDDGKRA